MSHPLWKFLPSKQEEGSITDILEKIPVFDQISRKDLLLIDKILHKRNYNKGEPIFYEGEPGQGMYIIKRGDVEIFSEKKERTTFATLGEGMFFGELSLLDGAPRSASAEAASACELYGFFKPDLMELIDKKPELGSLILLNLGSVLGERLRMTNQQLTKMKSENA